MTIDVIDREDIISHLINIVGAKQVLTDPESKFSYGKDLTHNYTPNPLAIVFPNNEQQVISIVKLANMNKIGLVPSGGRTGYSGGAVAKNQEIVVAFDRFNRIINFNAGDRQIECEPGVTTKTIQDFAVQNNLYYPVDFASSGSSQIGGNIATNAGGIKVIRYGSTRNWICGLKVVTGVGDLLNLNYGLIKNASGYDLRHLFIGSEGALGFITQATIQLTKLPTDTKVLLMAVSDNTHFIDILNAFNSTLSVTAFEFFSEAAIRHVIAETKLKHPFPSPTAFYLLLEYESDKIFDELALMVAEKCLSERLLENVLISSNAKQAATFWRFRREISMSLSRYMPYKYDIAVLPSKIATFVKDADHLFKNICPDLQIIWFGHVGDGNLHLNILKPATVPQDQFLSRCAAVSEQLYTIIQDYRGSVAAEHGIGLLKKSFLHYSKSEVEIDYMHAIKKVFDPNGIMNPGKII